MLFEGTDTEESVNSLSDVSSLENGMSKMQFESSASEDKLRMMMMMMRIHKFGVK